MPAQPNRKPVAPLETIEDGRIRWRRCGLLAVTCFVAGSFGLAAVAPVKSVAVASGEIRSVDEVVVVEHSAGGKVSAVYTQPDANVRAGAPLLALDARSVNAEIARLAIRRAHLALRRARLSALLEERELALPEDPRLTPFDLANARRLYEAEVAEVEGEAASLNAQLAERRADQRALAAAVISARAERDAYEAQAEISDALERRQLGTRRAALTNAAQLAETEARLAEMEGRLEAAAEAIAQLVVEKRRVAARRRATWSTALTEAAAELADTDAALQDARYRRSALKVTAPISGRILQLGAVAPGDVIAPGELIAEIVPSAEDGKPDLVAEVWISPNDIGHIHLDARAVVVVTAFDEEVFGEIEGRVLRISPSSIPDEQGAPRFRARVALSHIEAKAGDAVLRLAPGMLVSARIVTAERNLLQYLADPVTRALKVVFSER